MSRLARLDAPGVLHHVMGRGIEGNDIFQSVTDCQDFVDRLNKLAIKGAFDVYAWTLMPNHFHLLVKTPEANISRSMRHLNGVYTQRYNSRHKCDGQLFRGRYKSILTDTDSYLLQAVRYIHRNPLGAGLAAKLDAYKWSSHKGYISIAKKWDWLHKNYILSLLSKNRNAWLRYYKKWVSVEGKDKVSEKISGKKWPACIGPQSFVDRIKEAYGAEKIN